MHASSVDFVLLVHAACSPANPQGLIYIYSCTAAEIMYGYLSYCIVNLRVVNSYCMYVSRHFTELGGNY